MKFTPMTFQLAGIFVATMLISSNASSAEGPLTPIGASKIDITPTRPVRMSGYGNRRAESEGVAQKLWAKALAVGSDEGEGPALWITIENCGMTPTIAKAVADRLAEKSKVRRERIAITTSHSHTAPCLTNWAPFLFGMDIPEEHQAHIDQYTNELIGKMGQVAEEALRNRRPGRLSWGRGKVGFAANRRVLKDGKWTGFGVQKDGPVDHSLPILVATDADGKLISILANYACHCTTLGGDYNQIAGDWLGYAEEYIEAANPGCVSLITIGCGADANPEPRASKLELCQQHGRALADEVQRLLKEGLKPLDANISCRLTNVDLPFGPLPTKEQWQQAAKQNGAPGYHAQKFLARLEKGEEIPSTLSYPVGVWAFGKDLSMVFLGGEVVVDYALRLSKELDQERLWVTAYANDVCCYIPTKRILKEGGYEADFSMYFYARPTRFADEVEDIICDTVQKLTPHEFYSAEKRAEFPGPKSPTEALATMHVRPGFEVELVAAEPLIEDPVAFDWDLKGRLWVAEMCDYPNGIEWEKVGDKVGVPGGKIKLLTDTDGDGRYDRSSLFMDHVPFPNGIKAWRNGVLITSAPNVIYAEDTNGDGKADKTEILYSGFVEGNQQHRANGLRWGIDNWLYLANGDSGGSVKSSKTGDVVAISGRDLRIQPDSGRIEAVTGQSQFGRCSDDWGSWFGCNNANPMYHFTLEERYLRRNPHIAPPEVRRDVPEQPGTAPVFPTSPTLARFNDFHTANRFTSACSVEIYRDELLFGDKPPSVPENETFAGHVFICEPVHNLVHHAELSVRGLQFRSRRGDLDKNTEFLSSSDNWFRPVMARTGPDGALWVADMYRSVIEHPEWIPQVWQRKLDLRAGTDRGRIYRVFPKGHRPKDLVPIAGVPADSIGKSLESSNGVVRDMAQQAILWQGGTAHVAVLEQLAKKAVRPQTRLQAACSLDGLGKTIPELLETMLTDKHPGVRRNAIRLSEPILSRLPAQSRLVARLVTLTSDDDLFVRQQLSYSLGQMESANPGFVLADLAIANPAEPYLVAAVMSSLNAKNLGVFFESIMARSRPGPPPKQFVLRVIGMSAALNDRTLLNQVVSQAWRTSDESDPANRVALVADVLDAIAFRTRGSRQPLVDMLDKGLRERLESEFSQAITVLKDDHRSDAERASAMRLLVHRSGNSREIVLALGELLDPKYSSELQADAIQALSKIDDKSVVDQFVGAWDRLTPTPRSQILDILLSRPQWTSRLVDAIETGKIPRNHLDAARRQQLTENANESVRTKSAALFGSSSQSRDAVLREFGDVLKLEGNVARGKEVFAKRCSACHRLEEVGHSVGPDLTALTNRTPGALLAAVLDPNRAVEDKFITYSASTSDGRQFTGLLASETGTSITLAQAEGKRIDLLRRDIEQLRSTGKSLMPEGFEKDVPKQDFADVFAYVRNFSAPRKEFPGNRPEVAHVRDDLSIHMLAMNAKIFGPTVVFEEQYRNLGWWQSADDYVTWDVHVPKAGVYSVVLDYACDDSSQGNHYILTVGDQVLRGTISTTGGWDHYHSRRAGKVTLPAGPVELMFRSDGAVRNALVDLRAIRMQPQ